VERHNKFLFEINILIAKSLLYTYICAYFPQDGLKLPANYNQGRVPQVFVQALPWRRQNAPEDVSKEKQSVSLKNIIKVFLQFQIYFVTGTNKGVQERMHAAAEFLEQCY
jgi:hypothetical protein